MLLREIGFKFKLMLEKISKQHQKEVWKFFPDKGKASEGLTWLVGG
jgi:hypothetical protein